MAENVTNEKDIYRYGRPLDTATNCIRYRLPGKIIYFV